MSKNNVIKIGEAIHKIVEKQLQKGVRVSNRRQLTAEEQEAKRLRVEQAQRERGDFAEKTPARTTLDKADVDEPPIYTEELPPTDEAFVKFLRPTTGEQMHRIGSSLSGQSIIEELQEEIILGKLKPFVEGEPIGMIQYHHRGPAPAYKTHADLMNDEVTKLKRRRKRNDNTIKRLLRKLT